MKIVSFLQGAVFGPEEIEVINQAFATAALVLGLPSDNDERAQEVLGRSSSLRRRANAMS